MIFVISGNDSRVFLTAWTTPAGPESDQHVFPSERSQRHRVPGRVVLRKIRGRMADSGSLVESDKIIDLTLQPLPGSRIPDGIGKQVEIRLCSSCLLRRPGHSMTDIVKSKNQQ